MHEEIITTTSTAELSNNTIINSTSLHQSHNDDGTITVSIVHPLQHSHADLGDFIATNLNAPCSTTTNQIVPSHTKIIVTSNDLQTLKDDVSSVIINCSSSNTNDPNVLIIPTSESCDSDKTALSLSQLTSSQAGQAELDLQDVNSMNDETSSGEGEFVFSFLSKKAHEISSKYVADAVLSEKNAA